MNTRLLKLLLASTAALSFLPAVTAEPALDILANDGAFKPSIKFSDTYSEKIVTVPGLPSEPATHEVVAHPQKISARVVANLAEFDFAEISESMPVECLIGAFSFSAVLGDEESRGVDGNGDPKPFDPEKKSATFYFYVEVEQPNGDTVRRKTGSIVFAWSLRPRLLTVTLALSNAIDSGAGDISASEFIGLADDGENGGSVAFISETVPVAVNFGSSQGTRTAYGKGVTRTSYRKHGSEVAGTLEELIVNAVTVQGSGDITAPALAPTVPATDDDDDGFITFSGAVTDLPPGTLSGDIHPVELLVFLNDDLDPIATELEEPDARGKVAFTFTDLPLGAPVNQLRLVATDASGNVTTVTKRVTTAALFQ